MIIVKYFVNYSNHGWLQLANSEPLKECRDNSLGQLQQST